MTGVPRAIGLLCAYLLLTAALFPVQLALLALRLPGSRRLPSFYHRLTCRLMGFEVDVVGERSRARSVLFVSNHVSYLDISILGSVIPGSFIAKREVAQWPLYGTLARMQRTVFVDRRASRTLTHRDEVADRLAEGDNLILFPEGTSGDGNRVLRFKSAFFSVAEREVDGRPVTVQPVSIAYTHVAGLPLGRAMRPFYAWYGDMDLAGHLWALLRLGVARAEVRFHEPVTIAAFGNRKRLAAHCERAVAAGVAASLAGRDLDVGSSAPVEADALAAHEGAGVLEGV